MNPLPLFLCSLLGFLTTWLLIPLIRSKTTGGMMDRTRTFHQTHKAPVSRFGGVALAAAFVLITLVTFIWFPVDPTKTSTRLVIVFSSLAMFSLGLWDDIRSLGAKKKLAGQILIASAVCFFGVQIERFQNPFPPYTVYELGVWGAVLTVCWLVALTNVINLIDGIDGLAGGIALMLMGLLAYVGLGFEPVFPILCAAGMFGALMGFLRYNFPPAKIYMGDGGAYFLGFLIAILTVVHSQKGTIVAALIAPIFALALPIVDVSLAIIRRGLKGLPIFRADKKHIHHRLLEVGFSRTRTVLTLYAISSIFLLTAFGVFWSKGKWVPILFGFICLILLISARSFNFSRDWFAVGRVLENSLEIRKETHYALALGRWLEMEAERTDSLEELWMDFTFVAKKLGFSGVQLILQDGQKAWEAAPGSATPADLFQKHELSADQMMIVHFAARSDQMHTKLFEHLSELAAEVWLKAALRWHRINELPIRFDARISVAPPKLEPPKIVTAPPAMLKGVTKPL